ncbi:CpaF family protein [Candidatus Nephthysia bennettiae]|uniref:CpaF family protein n=1 Tax=Candidatus Nephthysia bennettiae TaxID=3127016 RepID=A0A934JW77_9BACT|nr:CpaF family protein [Candidatus Dormibacteraeota bacterium]MBJ7611963.1 CpaF family protein [Candidatus Dormibacteraeota bacterium]
MGQTSRGLLERVRENEAAEGRVVEPGGPISTDGESPAPPHLTVLDSATPETVAGNGPPLPPHLLAIKRTIHTRLLGRYAIEMDPSRRQEIREKILTLLDEHLRESGMGLTRGERDHLVGALLDDICGLGPLQVLMDDPDVTEVMINHPSQVYVERAGQITLSDVRFDDTGHLLRVIDRVVSSVGRHVDEANPYVDARLSDGSRVNVIIPPLALKGPSMTVRKFAHSRLGPDDILALNSATPAMLAFLRAAVRAGFNLLVSGGTGSGKTTLLNILSSYIPPEDRVITCEDAAELQLQQPHVITLESRPANVEGTGDVTIRDLVRNCLRMRPDRIVVGECRGGEALDMLQAMNTGHDGSMSTVHANSPIEAVSRLETLVLMSGTDLPSRAIREQIASAVHIVVQQQRLRGGGRRIVSISEVLGFDEHTGGVNMQELFAFNQIGVSTEGKAIGYHTAMGVLPKRMERFQKSGEDLPSALFDPTRQPDHIDLY